MKRKSTKVICLALFIGLCALLAKSASNKNPSYEEQLRKINLNQIDRIMITAHPDDEAIFGGNHLAKNRYLVVCVTAGINPKRDRELRRMTRHYHDSCIMLGYPDKTFGVRNNWKTCYKNINQDLTKILHKKKFKMIVTHNPDGEYGHIHHKMISKMVTKIASKSNMKLYYFNHYYTMRQLKNLELTSELSKQDSRQKLTNLNTFYPSQKKVIEHLKHILPYEQFISQKKWSSSKS